MADTYTVPGTIQEWQSRFPKALTYLSDGALSMVCEGFYLSVGFTNGFKQLDFTDIQLIEKALTA